MNIKRFGSFINEKLEEPSFMQRMEEDLEFVSEVKSILTLALETIEKYNHNLTDIESFKEHVLDSLVIDATNLVDFDISKQIDLCIYAEEGGYEKCPETEWNYLTQKINDGAIDGLSSLATNVIEQEFFGDFEKFMSANKLDYSKISHREGYGYAAAERMKHLKGGEVNQYRKLDGELDVDEYIYRNEELGIELFIEKIL